MIPILFAFLHHITAFLVFGALLAELMLIKNEVTPALARSLLRADAIYGVSALALIVVGLVRVSATEKGLDYYLHSGTFIVKMLLFVLAGLISIYPTRRYLAWRRELKANRVPVLGASVRANISRAVHLQLGLLSLVILCAVLMARGIGYFG